MTDKTGPCAGSLAAHPRLRDLTLVSRKDVQLALEAGFSLPEVRYMLDLFEDETECPPARKSG